MVARTRCVRDRRLNPSNVLGEQTVASQQELTREYSASIRNGRLMSHRTDSHHAAKLADAGCCPVFAPVRNRLMHRYADECCLGRCLQVVAEQCQAMLASRGTLRVRLGPATFVELVGSVFSNLTPHLQVRPVNL